MTAQADLRVEAAHLRRFYFNFYSVRSSVTAPCPVSGYETEAVLVETFEPGHSVAKYMRTASPLNTKVRPSLLLFMTEYRQAVPASS